MAKPAANEPPDSTPVPPSVRAQLLATEHWSLLASRSTTQSEVLTRISIFLTVVSAGLVTLALVGQATRFSETFGMFAILVLALIATFGQLTQLRVLNVGMEDLMYVLAMNRLRAAYLELDPGIAPYLMSSPHDDQPGSDRTYYFLGYRSTASHLGASSMIMIAAVNAALVGLLAAAIASLLAAPSWLLIVVGIVLGLASLAASMWWGGRAYYRFWTTYTPYNPTPEP